MAESISIDKILLHLTCKECGNSYPHRLSKPKDQKTCRCGKGYFRITVSGVGGKRASIRAHVEFEYANTRKEVIEVDSIEIED
jgi:hypothetical protein